MAEKDKVRVRFAPSPTGLAHLGNFRTTLFNWLFAKQHRGDFILRIEDTDQKRFDPAAEDYLKQSLLWLGLDWNEGIDKGGPYPPYRQSQRLDTYKEYALKLIEQGRAYRDWTTSEELANLRAGAHSAQKPFLLRQEMLKTAGDLKQPHVIRFKIDPSFNPAWKDEVRGNLSQAASSLDDFIAIKSDGFPTYNFANIIDDHLMAITHVIRGDEFIASTPKFLQVYQALAWGPPVFAHVPQVLGPDKTKLSKRHGAEPVLKYREHGYLPIAILNFLALLGWNDGTEQEVFEPSELIAKFSLERIQRGPAVFDRDKLDWFNGLYIREKLTLDDLIEQSDRFWPPTAKSAPTGLKKRVLEVTKERLKHFDELAALTAYFFAYEPRSKTQLTELTKTFATDTAGLAPKAWLAEAVKIIQDTAGDRSQLESALKARVEQQAGKRAALWIILREILANGTAQTPPIWEIVYALGLEEAMQRLDAAIQIL